MREARWWRLPHQDKERRKQDVISSGGAVIPSHPPLAFLRTDSSCREGEVHKVVTGGGYRGATFLGFCGSFKVLEARLRSPSALLPPGPCRQPICSRSSPWSSGLESGQRSVWGCRRVFGVGGGFGAVGGHGDAPCAEAAPPAEPASALPEHQAHHTLHLLLLLQLFRIYSPVISLDIFTCKKSQDKTFLTNL